MWPIFGLNLVFVVVVVWAVRRLERRSVALEHITASLRDELVSIRAERSHPSPPPAPPAPPPTAPPTDEWTEAKNARRIALIDREIDEVITPEEAKELELLQQEMRRYVNRVAPLPLDEARELHRQLLETAAKSQSA